MTGRLALVVHAEPELQQRLGDALSGAGFKLLLERPGRHLRKRLDALPFLPDVLLTEWAPNGDGESTVLASLQGHPLAERIPVVLLASGDAGERRAALRRGVAHLALPPYDEEEIILLARRAVMQAREDRLLTGSLGQLPLTDLLQILSANQKSGMLTLRSRGREGTMWLRGGRVVDATTEDGRSGEEAVYAIALWEEGSFEAELGPVEVPERIAKSTTHLLLEAMRRKDEAARRGEPPPHAALEDPPPAPPRALLAVHRALTLLNIAGSYSAAHMLAPMVERRLEEARRRAASRHPILERFAVGAGGVVTADRSLRVDDDPRPVVDGVSAWLRAYFERAERALPGRFDLARLSTLSEVVQDDLRDLGFYRALGLVRDGKEET